MIALVLVEREAGAVAIVGRRHTENAIGVRLMEIELPRESKKEGIRDQVGDFAR